MGREVMGDGGADAAEKAAKEQRRVSIEQYNQTKDITDRATVSGIASFEQDLKNQEKNLARQEALISQIDPTIVEASQQVLKLMRGEDSTTLSPLKRQRELQRQKLLNSLREQLGPGAETSTAGIQALTRFDSESANIFGGAQQQAMGTLTQIGNSWGNSRPDMFREIMGRSQFGQGKSNLLMNQASILSGAGKGLIDTAGAQYTGDVMRGKQDLAWNNQLLEMGVRGATAYATGGASEVAPKQKAPVA